MVSWRRIYSLRQSKGTLSMLAFRHEEAIFEGGLKQEERKSDRASFETPVHNKTGLYTHHRSSSLASFPKYHHSQPSHAADLNKAALPCTFLRRKSKKPCRRNASRRHQHCILDSEMNLSEVVTSCRCFELGGDDVEHRILA